MLVLGTSHRFHGGIYPDRIAWLWENDRPRWTVQSLNPNWEPVDQEALPDSPETILQSGLALLLGVKQSEVGVDMSGIKDALSSGAKIVVICLDGSALTTLAPELVDLPCQIELAATSSMRWWHAFDEGMREEGPLFEQ